jgi:DNA-binding NarL/FixJ family response regulator
MIKIILAGDQNIVRNGIRNLLERDGRFEIIGEASSAAALFEVLDKGFIPEIILADSQMPELLTGMQNFRVDGITIPKIVLLTTDHNHDLLVTAFGAGVMGYLLKNISSEELLFALSFVHHQNKRYISAALAPLLLDLVSNLQQHDHNGYDGHDGHNGVVFTKREFEVLELISEGYTNQQIADKLFTSRRTVEGHRQSLMDKAEVSNSAALIKYAFRNKLIA